ncbi:MAG: hypothetical protein OMM_05530 [Candidatus Magnetoglobus multicellularis str. Araruama]|uniref:Uncharacterized protein n=1 Tax=Candidatus Magnetoglobus multicellularis str. Araruama TaxID=890399 RepID=A0A1V1NVT0_9BACT|nr:MAG: hypothetical protein OMM_05530 [Candidatus Magnetoglobus multicellularis str. Araruama]
MKYHLRIIYYILIMITSLSFAANAQLNQLTILYSETEDEEYGNDVAISGDYALVIAQESCKLYAYKRSGNEWNKIQEISIDQSNYNDKPYALDMDGEYAVVGKPSYSNGSISLGATTVLKRTGDVFSIQTTLTPTDQSESSAFGYNVAIKGDYFVVGAHSKNCAYIYKRNGESWNLVKN